MCPDCTDALIARYSRPAGLALASTLGDEMIRADGILSAAMAEGYDKDFGLLSPGSATNRLAEINERVVAAVKRIGRPVVVWGPDRCDDESEGGYLMVRPDAAGSVEWTSCPHGLLDWGPEVVSGFAFTPDGDPLPPTGLRLVG